MLWKLIKLELKKTKWRGLLLSAVITNLMVALWVVSSDVPNNGVRSYDRVFQSIMNYSGVTFIIFASVLMSRMIIDEYRNKTITLLFAYPVPRKMIFLAKLIIIGTWTFVTELLNNIFVVISLLIANSHYHYITEPLTTERLQQEAIRMLIFAFACASVALIPLYLGMIRKTMPALIISSFLLSNAAMVIVNNLSVEDGYGNFVMAALLCFALGVLMAYAGVRRSQL
ncbi:ABC transporter permease [Paenibacillus qinlingensis]|uniref:ABC-type transport system involved in multi-copper enzyme maturation permease subunit n=1 Tax=Paenibacillus qinlingensis TaxID=1837343 RepID=A0ABU1NY69_9BACL|nr:ABC transporter permease [Paenibacillus qinlingensis]MDR6552444.1 ABC-type transport system involved in multi-copper enzyme maturation permease subunit [Paenibacillus qinlingensis]